MVIRTNDDLELHKKWRNQKLNLKPGHNLTGGETGIFPTNLDLKIDTP